MKYTSVPNRHRAVPQGFDMRPFNQAAEIGYPISIPAGTRGAHLLEHIHLKATRARPRIQHIITEFAEKEFVIPVHTELRLIPFEENYLVSLKAALDQLVSRKLEAARLEHILAFHRRYYCSGSGCRLIPAFGSLERDGMSDLADFLFVDERENMLRTDSLYYNAISSDLSQYLVAAVPAAE